MARRHAPRPTIAAARVAAALLAAAVVLRAADLTDALLGLALVAIVVPATWIDLDRRLIPNRLTAAGALATVAILSATDPALLPERLLWAAAAGGFLLVAALARPDGMGMGDVKLAAVLGLLLGRAVVGALLLALLAGTLAGAVVLLRHGARAARTATLPFGPLLALGALVAWFA